MKKISLLFASIVLVACQSPVKKDDVTKLNGYWEIKHVEMPNGKNIDYKVNETVDYFEVKNNMGFRQKVMPQFDGKFKTNRLIENIKILEKENSFFIEYQTNYGKWQEEIIEIADSTLILKNKEKIEYQYKRFTPFSLK